MVSSVNDSNTLIAVRGVSYSYGSFKVLKKVTLDINTGDFLAIIGPNGSGKTTLIKIVLGLLEPEEGEIRITGRPLEEFKEWSKIGYVPQKATHIDPFFPVSVKEVVAMGLLSQRKLFGLSKKEEESSIHKALSQVGMEEFHDRRIGSLSAGQQQRIFIARAVVSDPHILFLDEPTTGVDAETQERFYDMLDDLNKKEKITIVLVTHEIGIMNRHVNQVACLNQRLIYHGTHAEFCRSDAFKKMLEGGHHVISHRH
ncbi:MAG: metal ABC transporter ATP-binding protein [Candidatus Aminicenantes bacterium]